MKHIIALFFCSIIISGCATHVSSIQGNYEFVSVKLDSKTNDTLLLISNSQETLDKSQAYDGSITFKLPGKYSGSTELCTRA